MNKMKRIFSFVLAFVITLGAFSSFSTMALAADAKEDDKEKVEATKEDAKDDEKEEDKEEEKAEGEEAEKPEGEEEKEEEEKPAEDKPAGTEFLKEVPADVKGTDYEKSVKRLVAFGVVGGYPDGTFKPERELNRAQFATMVVQALGLDDAKAATTENNTGFTDVAAGYWGAGAINIASAQGLIKGFPDGTFRPAAKVTYAQVLTVLVRALGYEDQFLYGNWPSNYISKAAELKISGAANIPTNYNEVAIRGEVAKLFDKTLHTDTITVTKYEGTAIAFEPKGEKLMTVRLGITKDGGRVVGDMFVDETLGENKVKLQTTDKDDKVIYPTLDLEKSAAHYREYMGKEVDAYIKSKKAILLEPVEDSGTMKFEYVVDAFPLRDETLELNLAGFGGNYRLDEDAVFYVFNAEKGKYEQFKDEKLTTKETAALVGRVGRIVVADGAIVYGEIMSDDLLAKEFMVVKEEAKDNVLKGASASRGDDSINFTERSKFEDVYVFDELGKLIAVEDIKVGDVVYAQDYYYKGKESRTRDTLFATVVQGNNVTGELGRVTDTSVDIDKDKYGVLATETLRDAKDRTKTRVVNARVSLDLLESVEPYTKEIASELFEEDVIGYRGAGDLVALLANNDEDAGAKYGIITRVDERDARVEIFTTLDDKKQEVVRFDLATDDDIYDPIVVNAEGKVLTPRNSKASERVIKGVTGIGAKGFDFNDLIGQPVRFRVSKDNVIPKNALRFLHEDAYVNLNGTASLVRFGTESMYYGNDPYEGSLVASNAKVIEPYGIDVADLGSIDVRDMRKNIDDFMVYEYDDISFSETDKSFDMGLFRRTNGDVDGVAVFAATESGNRNKGTDKLVDINTYEESVFVTDLGQRGDNYNIKYDSYQSGADKTDEGAGVDLRDHAGVKEAKAYLASVNRRGRITLEIDKDGKDNAPISGSIYKQPLRGVTVKSVDAVDRITVELADGSTEKVRIARSALVYDIDPERSRVARRVLSSDIKKGQTVDVIMTKGNVAEVVTINLKPGAEDDKVSKLEEKAVYEVVDFLDRGADNVYVILKSDRLSKPVTVKLSDYAAGQRSNPIRRGDSVKVKWIVDRDGEDIITEFLVEAGSISNNVKKDELLTNGIDDIDLTKYFDLVNVENVVYTTAAGGSIGTASVGDFSFDNNVDNTTTIVVTATGDDISDNSKSVSASFTIKIELPTVEIEDVTMKQDKKHDIEVNVDGTKQVLTFTYTVAGTPTGISFSANEITTSATATTGTHVVTATCDQNANITTTFDLVVE